MKGFFRSIDGQKIFPSTDDTRVETDLNGLTRLFIDTTKFDKNATIGITARNDSGMDEADARLTVQENRLELTRKLENQTVEKGQSARFETQIKNAKPR